MPLQIYTQCVRYINELNVGFVEDRVTKEVNLIISAYVWRFRGGSPYRWFRPLTTLLADIGRTCKANYVVNQDLARFNLGHIDREEMLILDKAIRKAIENHNEFWNKAESNMLVYITD